MGLEAGQLCVNSGRPPPSYRPWGKSLPLWTCPVGHIPTSQEDGRGRGVCEAEQSPSIITGVKWWRLFCPEVGFKSLAQTCPYPVPTGTIPSWLVCLLCIIKLLGTSICFQTGRWRQFNLTMVIQKSSCSNYPQLELRIDMSAREWH